MYAAVKGARSFREDHYGHASGQLAFGILHCASDGSRRMVVDEDVSSLAATVAHEGYVLKAFFHHPFEVMTEVAVDRENIISSLVIGNENV